MLIYAAKNIFTGKVYIGSTVQSLQDRKWRHESRAREGLRPGLMYRDIRRLGADSFEWQTLMFCDSAKQMRSFEAEIIDLLDTHKNGYNVARDGANNRGGHASEATRKTQSESHKQWWKNHDPEVRKTWKKRGPFRLVMEPNKEAVLELHRQGKSCVEIAAVFDCHPSSVSNALIRWRDRGG